MQVLKSTLLTKTVKITRSYFHDFDNFANKEEINGCTLEKQLIID